MQSKVKNNSNIKPQGITLISLVVTILIPDNVTTINIRVFQGCSNLKKYCILFKK